MASFYTRDIRPWNYSFLSTLDTILRLQLDRQYNDAHSIIWETRSIGMKPATDGSRTSIHPWRILHLLDEFLYNLLISRRLNWADVADRIKYTKYLKDNASWLNGIACLVYLFPNFNTFCARTNAQTTSFPCRSNNV